MIAILPLIHLVIQYFYKVVVPSLIAKGFANVFKVYLFQYRLFTVLYFSVRSSRSSALRYGLPSCLSVKTTLGAGAVWEEARKIEGL